MTLEKYLTEIEARVNNATPGPWRISRLNPLDVVTSNMTLDELPRTEENAFLIAHAPTNLKKLIEVVRVLCLSRSHDQRTR